MNIRWILLSVALVGCVPKAKYTKLEGDFQECKQDLRAAQSHKEKGDRVHEDVLASLRPLIDKGVLEVERVHGRTVVGMRAEVLFAPGSAELSDGGRQTVQEVAHALSRQTDARWQVEGHTDDTPIHTDQFPNNWYLGAARAITVVDEMIHAGMTPRRLSAATFGQFAPVAPNDTEPGKARNRRIEIVLLPEVKDERPGGDRPPRKPGPRPPRPR